MGSTLAPEWQRGGLEQMESPVNNLIHERKWEVLDREWACKSDAPQVEAGSSAGRWRIHEQGEFSPYPPSLWVTIQRLRGSRLSFHFKRICTIFTGLCSAWWRIIIPELNDFAAHETGLTVAAETSRKEGELHFETARMIKLTLLICNRLRVPLDGLHQFDLIKDGVIDCIYWSNDNGCLPLFQMNWLPSSCQIKKKITKQGKTHTHTQLSSSKCGDCEMMIEREKHCFRLTAAGERLAHSAAVKEDISRVSCMQINAACRKEVK